MGKRVYSASKNGKFFKNGWQNGEQRIFEVSVSNKFIEEIILMIFSQIEVSTR